MRVWAWSRPGVTNFGDELGPAILKRLGVDVTRVTDPAEADIVTAGSVLTHVSGRDGIIVWGTGTLRGTDTVDASRLDVRAVRGAGTRDLAGLWPGITLGDPGLLVSQLWDRAPVRHRVGWAPHYRDPRRVGRADITIDLLAPVDDVIEQITSCREIITSSLHALIVADAFGIPRLHSPSPRVIGAGWKFRDYETAYAGRDVADVQARLLTAIGDLLP